MFFSQSATAALCVENKVCVTIQRHYSWRRGLEKAVSVITREVRNLETYNTPRTQTLGKLQEKMASSLSDFKAFDVNSEPNSISQRWRK